MAGQKHSPRPHKEGILPANEKHINIHQSKRKRALESGFDGWEWLEGAVKAEHTRRSRHSGAGVISRTKKGQKRTVKECKWLKKNNGTEEKKQKELRVRDVTGAVRDGRGQEEGKKATSEIGDILYSSSSSGKKAHPAYS